ncbi:fucolectin-1-like isoform X2 [Betta splendens]|uniref:Fucolectin-1-like isoform X2 n=2 Tax=Betta splendens TaxID=158456 RepID=A0A8M1H3F2_BETSP|nr:fucolectin-1-like isoform X2 [Betta splendens]
MLVTNENRLQEGETVRMMWSLLFMSLIIVSNTQNLIKVEKTSQSSTFTYGSVTYSSERAVVGNWAQCTDTNARNNSWWSADLLGLYEIYNIMIYIINQSNIKMEGAQIVIGNSSEKTISTSNLCKTITNFTLNQNNTFQCDGGSIWGRYVTIYLQTNILILCEVQIYGIRKGLMLIPENRTWLDSLIYCRDHNMDLAYIHDNETQAWAELELQNSNSPFVWLGLHYTCTLGFWFWVGGHPLQYKNWDPNEKRKNECDMSVAMKKDNHSWYSKPDNETFNFMCII